MAWGVSKAGAVAVDAKEHSGKVAAFTHHPAPNISGTAACLRTTSIRLQGPSLAQQLSGVDGGGKRRSHGATGGAVPLPPRAHRVAAGQRRRRLRLTSGTGAGVAW
jgi:hypothetical protein